MSYNNCVSLVTVEEAIKLSEVRTIRDMYIANDIYKECVKVFVNDEQLWKHFKTISTIWNAGRIQGIREERAKHKK